MSPGLRISADQDTGTSTVHRNDSEPKRCIIISPSHSIIKYHESPPNVFSFTKLSWIVVWTSNILSKGRREGWKEGGIIVRVWRSSGRVILRWFRLGDLIPPRSFGTICETFVYFLEIEVGFTRLVRQMV